MSVRPAKSERALRMRSVAHFCTAAAITSEGIMRLEMHEIPWPFIILCWTSAAVIAAVTIAHLRHGGGKYSRQEIPIFLLESFISVHIAFLSFKEHQNLLPYAWLLIAVLWINAAAIFFFKTRHPAQHPKAAGAVFRTKR